MYIIAQDIADRYGQELLDRISTPRGQKQSDPNVIQKGIDAADATIDAFISNRYTLPLAVVPPILVKLAVDIAVYEMPIDVVPRTLEMRVRYDDAITMLKGIAAGTVGIGLSIADLTTNGDEDVAKQTMGKSIRTFRM